MTDDVSPDRPDSTIRTVGTDHVTLIGSNRADTIEFYRDVLGMRLVMEQPNLDDPSQTHLFFDTGDGRIVTFFVTDEREFGGHALTGDAADAGGSEQFHTPDSASGNLEGGGSPAVYRAPRTFWVGPSNGRA